MSARKSSSQPLPHLVLGIALCFVRGCPLLSPLAHGQAAQKTPSELDTAIASIRSGNGSGRDVVIVANAGAVPPIFCRGGEITTMRVEGFPLGMFPEADYEEFSVATQPDDAFVFVSDGITDAENAQGEMYGMERLCQMLCGHRLLPAAEIAEAIFADVARFQAGQPRFDDETILVLRVR